MAAAGGANLIPLVAAIIGIGVVSQVLSDRFQVPSVVFLIASGILLGPEVLGVISPDSFGNALQAIVGLSVAIIVFEGAFHLRIDKLREAPAATFRLVTVGAIISFVATGVVVHYALGAPWPVSFLVGALLVATGPTVIAPILEVVPVRDRVGAALDTEGIVNDVTAAIVAVVIFEAILEGVSSPDALVTLFAERLGVGVVVGAIVAGSLYYVATEAGIAAVATAGILLGNADVPYEEEISAFKGDITLLVLSFVFIALAALLDFQNLLNLGVGGLAVVAAVALVIRPFLVFVSARGDRFTREEKLFMSFVGPRGIIPASVASLFAIALQEEATRLAAEGMTQQAAALNQSASILVGTVFLVILTTVVFEAGLARRIAEYLDVIPMRVLIIGGGKVGRALAERLADRGENVVLIEQDQEVVQTARNMGFTVHHGDGADTSVLRSAGAANAKFVVAATGDDDVNLLVAQLANSKFDPESVLARANNPDNVEAFEELGVRTISSTIATAQALDNYIERPSMSNWMGEIGRSGDVQEVEVTAERLIGRTIREVGPELPDGCLVTLVSRNGDTTVPNAEYTLQEGDRITIIGEREAVRDAEELVNPE